MRPALSAMDPSHDTAVLLTPPGPAAIAVVRLAGPGVGPFLARQFSGPTPDGRCVHGMLRDEAGNVVDDPVVVCSSGGAVADLNVHGGAWVVESVLAMASRNGFARADAARDPIAPEDPAETQLEREALAHLPLARTELALRTLLAQPAAWAGLAASGQPLAKGELERVLADRSLQHLLALPPVAIVGAPNVGKSTLANQLFGTERSITADLPGTTRDWVGEVANVDGLAVMLLDTPGVRETADPIERGAIERGGAEVRRANLVVLVLDATRPLRPEQEPLLRAYGENALRVINKVDGPAAWDAGAITAIRTVASTGQGVAQVRDAIRERFGCLDVPPERVRVWTARQRAIVERAIADPTALRELL